MITFDKRLELLEALVIAVKQINTDELNEELDFVEFYDIPYVKELVNKINIEKYPEIIDYINNIKDCSKYTNMFLYFDDKFNLDEQFNLKPFEHKNAVEFVKIIKNIYEGERIEEVFIKYRNYLNNLERNFENNCKINFKEKLSQIYENINNLNFYTTISLLINGGFSSTKDNNVYYVKGIKVQNNSIIFNEYTIVCLYHEYSHFFVNKIIDKYFDKINNLDILYDECIKNGLPQTYQNKKTILYEYFVRANSMILSENEISNEEYKEDIEWFKEIGFIRIEEIINLIKSGLINNLKFEDIFSTIFINYFNELNLKNNKIL